MIVNFFVVDDFSERGYRIINKNCKGTLTHMFNMPIGSMVIINGNTYRVGAVQWLDMDKCEPEQYVELMPEKKWI